MDKADISPIQFLQPFTFQHLEKVFLLPFHVYCKDRNSRYLACSQLMADNLGLNKMQDIVGITDYDTIVSRASADEFVRQDKHMLQINKTQIFIDSAAYKKNKEMEFLTIKLPLLHTSDTLAILGISMPFSPGKYPSLNNILSFLRPFSSEALTPISLALENIQKIEILSIREKECLMFLIKGYSTREMAEKLSLSKRTVEDYIERTKNKLNCYSKKELIQYVLEFLP